MGYIRTGSVPSIAAGLTVGALVNKNGLFEKITLTLIVLAWRLSCSEQGM